MTRKKGSCKFSATPRSWQTLRISNAERFAKPLQDWRSPPFEPSSWPDASTVEAAMQACRDTHRALVDADRKLNAADRKLLRPLAG